MKKTYMKPQGVVLAMNLQENVAFSAIPDNWELIATIGGSGMNGVDGADPNLFYMSGLVGHVSTGSPMRDLLYVYNNMEAFPDLKTCVRMKDDNSVGFPFNIFLD